MTTKRETCLTCGKVFMTGPNTTARDVAQAHESMTGHTIERSVKPEPRIVAECGCNVVGKDSEGALLPECRVLNFQYYGGRCKDE